VILRGEPRHWPDDAHEAFEERAAVMEYEALTDRDEAERQAEQRVRREWAARKEDR